VKKLLLGAFAAAFIAGPALAETVVVKPAPGSRTTVDINQHGNTVIHNPSTGDTTKIRTTPDGSTKIIEKDAAGNKAIVKVPQ
jgi:opacity protein-like surface antigen